MILRFLLTYDFGENTFLLFTLQNVLDPSMSRASFGRGGGSSRARGGFSSKLERLTCLRYDVDERRSWIW